MALTQRRQLWIIQLSGELLQALIACPYNYKFTFKDLANGFFLEKLSIGYYILKGVQMIPTHKKYIPHDP